MNEMYVNRIKIHSDSVATIVLSWQVNAIYKCG